MPLNKSSARTIDILELLSHSQEPLTLIQICEELSLPKSSAFEILNTLIQKGAVVYANEQLKTFKLSMKIFRIGTSVLAQTDLYGTAHPMLVRLGRMVGETAYLAVENNGRITYLDKVENQQPIRATCVIGSSNYMHITGLGKALLATYSESKVRKIIGDEPLKMFTPQSITSPAQLMKELELVRQRGYAIDDRESMESVHCIAAPIRDYTGCAVAAISLAALYSRMTDEYAQALCGPLLATALDISHQLGFTGDRLY